MEEVHSVLTWDFLKVLGFQDEIAIGEPSLTYDFLNFKLSACCVLNTWFNEVVLLQGTMATPRSLADVSIEMPLKVQSRPQCAAWITWHLDRAADGGVFRPARATDWLLEGRQNFNLLPWVAEMAAYNARPRCSVRRDWLRVAVKTLREVLFSVDDEALVEITFDGAVLLMRCAGSAVVLPGVGAPWPKQYSLVARKLRNLPKRIMSEKIEVSIWEEQLRIGRNVYSGLSSQNLDDVNTNAVQRDIQP